MHAQHQRRDRFARHVNKSRPRKIRPGIEPLEQRLTPSGAPFAEPPVLHSQNGVLTATLTESEGPAVVGDTLVANAWTYNNSYVGPTLEVNPGDLLDLTIVNQLGQPTNLHTHGLHVSPLGNSDDVLLDIEPGQSNHYRIQIPANHAQGLYWYHPHMHGFVDPQIAMGLSGLLVIGRADGGAPQLNGLPQRLLALKNALLAGNQIVTPIRGPFDPSAQTFTINGQLNPVLTLPVGQWNVFNVANIGNNAFYGLRIYNPTPPSMQSKFPHTIAIGEDGNPLTVAKQVLGDNGGFAFPPGRRWSFTFPPPTDANGNYVAGTLYVVSTGINDGTHQWPGSMSAPFILMTINYTLPANMTAPVTDGETLSPPQNFFRDLSTIPESQIAAHRTVLFGETMVNGMMIDTINGQQFPNPALFQPRLGTVEEWTLINPTPNDHPFHLHVDAQQVILAGNINSGGNNLGNVARFLDVINVPHGTTVVIRIGFNDFLGEFVYHCHRVDHEDDGMMALVNVIPQDPFYAVGANAGRDPRVKVTNPVTGAVVGNFLAFPRSYQGGVRVAVGDVNGDGVYDIIVGKAQGSSQVKVIDGTKLNQVDPKTGVIRPSALLGNFLAYEPGFQGGVFVAAGDINGDGLADVITGPGIGRRSAVRVIDARKLNQGSPTTTIKPSALLANFLAYERNFLGGVRVAAGDNMGDGRIDIVTGQGPGGSRVKVFGGPGLMTMADFQPFGNNFDGGVFVGTGNVKGFAFDDVIVGQGPGSRPRVRVYSDQMGMMHHPAQLNLGLIDSFLAYNRNFDGGVQVASFHDSKPLPTFGGNRDDVLTTHATGPGSAVRVFPRTIAQP
jgi:suppressor of ftsI